mmetsp:Transcript_1971/g.5191  ORF Transcript_1971/g.5191 Transcript_1971/m.5191 type:complete len:110 (+) Transcript_1971:2109-2438(+)
MSGHKEVKWCGTIACEPLALAQRSYPGSPSFCSRAASIAASNRGRSWEGTNCATLMTLLSSASHLSVQEATRERQVARTAFDGALFGSPNSSIESVSFNDAIVCCKRMS